MACGNETEQAGTFKQARCDHYPRHQWQTPIRNTSSGLEDFGLTYEKKKCGDTSPGEEEAVRPDQAD